MKSNQFNELKVFENYEILKLEKGHSIVSTRVVESSLNLYQNAHGGYLFTLCDASSGYVNIANGTDVVTLSSSINYIRGAKLDDVLTIESKVVHDGRSTKVVETNITNQNGKLVVKSTFTMYPITAK